MLVLFCYQDNQLMGKVYYDVEGDLILSSNNPLNLHDEIKISVYWLKY